MSDMTDLFNKNVFKPYLNVGALMDIPTGTYFEGKHGEMILSGGNAPFIGIGGKANTFKSQLAHYINFTTIARYNPEMAILYDTEGNIVKERLIHLAKHIEGFDIDRIFDEDKPVHVITDNSVYGDEFYENLKLLNINRQQRKKSLLKETPFVDKDGKYKTVMTPLPIELDSISQFAVSDVALILEKNKLGDSSTNTEALTDARLKSQIISRLPTICSNNGYYLTATAHVGSEHKLDKYAPSTKALSFMPSNVKFKRAPENFTFLTNYTWYCHGLTVLTNSDKTCEYPHPDKGTFVGDADLVKIAVTAWRGKSGSSGIPFYLIFSQSDGLQIGLTELNHLRENKSFKVNGTTYPWGWGIIGSNVKDFRLELLPDVKLTRTTVRKIIDENYKLRRAFTITAEMHQIFSLWKIPEYLKCTPAQLKEDLTKKGYDWDTLLETRGYWVFNDTKHPRNFLSTFDLLRMRVDEYRPYWLKDTKTKKK